MLYTDSTVHTRSVTILLDTKLQAIIQSGLPTLRLKKVWKLSEVLNTRVTTGHRPAQTQEVPAEKERSSRFCLGLQKFICKIE